jgi:hypothetical protein
MVLIKYCTGSGGGGCHNLQKPHIQVAQVTTWQKTNRVPVSDIHWSFQGCCALSTGQVCTEVLKTRKPNLHRRPVYVGFVVNRVALVQIFFRVQ